MELGEYTDLTSVVLQPITFCNLDCRYCYLPDRASRNLMEPTTAESTVRSLLDITGGDGRPLSILWHGGEPMSCGSQHMRRLLSPFGQLSNIRHRLQSNGTLISARWLDLIHEFDIEIGLSLDGPEWANIERVDRRGRASFDRALAGAKMLAKGRRKFGVISVVNGNNIDTIANRPEEYLQFFLDLGVTGLCLNFEEAEGENIAKAAVPGADHVKRLLDQIANARSSLGASLWIREIDHPAEGLRFLVSNPETIGSPPDLFPTIAYNGDVVCLSPELAGHTSDRYGDFVAGNVNRESLRLILERFVRSQPSSEYLAGRQMCEETCMYFAYCGGGLASNKVFELGTMRGTETDFCRTMVQAPFDQAIQRMEHATVPDHA